MDRRSFRRGHWSVVLNLSFPLNEDCTPLGTSSDSSGENNLDVNTRHRRPLGFIGEKGHFTCCSVEEF